MKNKGIWFLCLAFALVVTGTVNGCGNRSQSAETKPLKSRLESIPSSAVKVTPATDSIPPVLHSSDFREPVPLGDGVNTAGAEDSAFIVPDGNTIYFFFTPDPNIPAEKQLTDGVTGIYRSQKVGGVWQTAERVLLQDKDDVSLDGCVLVQGDQMWFCSARKGNYRGVDMWIADLKNNKWTNWHNAGKLLNRYYQVGEMHLTADGKEIYFHADRAGGKGGVDIWVTKKVGGEWQEPENVTAVNSSETEGWPFVTQDGTELWFLRWYQGSPAIFRSRKSGGEWEAPELIMSHFAAEPTLDSAGNLYFIHHYYKDGKMLEADVFVAYRK